MNDTEGRRRLAAILAADASGYSRLMAADEDATVAALERARGVFKARIETSQGRTIDTAGDSVLAVFETAAGAVSAALAIQMEIEATAAALPLQQRLQFRIGIHLGDVIEKADGTVYGDGVNIAARLQALAQPGGVSVSGIVHEAVRDRLSADFSDQGEHAVKNIMRPVRVYRVNARDGRRAAAPAARWRSLVLAATLLLVVAVGGWFAGADAAGNARAALAAWFGKKPPAAAAARASIAVMPFANLSGDPKRDYFSDGITEDVIHALGRFSGLMVLSRQAVQAYTGRATAASDLSRDLAVRYIAQGSVRQAGAKVRVVVELSEADKGTLLWSEQYEGEGTEVFDIQDRIVNNIVGALAVKLTREERRRVFGKPTDSLEAYDLVLRARSLLERNERVANREARASLAQAQKLAPDYDEIVLTQAEAELQRALFGWVEDMSEAARRAEALCLRVLASGDSRTHARAHGILATIYSNQARFEEALSQAERAAALNPSDSTALFKRGMALLYVGRIDEAIAVYETARRFEPQLNAGESFSMPLAYYLMGRYQVALGDADVMLARSPGHVGLQAIRAATLAQMGRADEARQVANAIRLLSPTFDPDSAGSRFRNPEHAARFRDGLRKAGL